MAEAVAEIRRRFPKLAPGSVEIVAAVNAEYAPHDTLLNEGDLLALIPPVSGGSSMIEITHHPLNPDEVTAKVRKDTNGGVVTFLGTTRSFFEGRSVLYLEYEAYPDMALNQMEDISRDIQAKWGIEDIAASHRIGRVDIGEISLVVAVASPHRKEAFHACHEFVDRLKQTVPHMEERVLRGRLPMGRLRRPRTRTGPLVPPDSPFCSYAYFSPPTHAEPVEASC